MPSVRHSCRCRASSTSRTIGLLRMSFLIAYSKSIPLMRTSQSRAAWRCAPAGCAPLPSSAGTSGRLRQDPQALAGLSSARNVCLTIRSSSEWNVITASRAPASSRLAAPAEERVEPVELAVDPDPQRLERARRRIDPLVARAAEPPAGRSRRAGRSSSIGASRRASTIARATRRECALLAELVNHVGERRSRRRRAAGRRRSARGSDPCACRAARRGGS